jgi:hypothetical protein
MIERYLDDLEARLDVEEETQLRATWRAFASGQAGHGIFEPRRRRCFRPLAEWRKPTVNETLEDFEAMALQQLCECSAALAAGTGAVLNVRANYGTGILPSLFGCRLHVMGAALNTLPTVLPVDGGEDAIRRLVGRGVPDLTAGLGARVLEMGERFVSLFRGYPRVRRFVHIYHPDLQGPIDACELLWGSSMFLAMIEQPDLVKELLALVTLTYRHFLRRWMDVVPVAVDDGFSAHWGMLHRGAIMLREDSAMNLSPELIEEFVVPCDQLLLDEFGGGAIHFCGRGDHFIGLVAAMRGVYGVNLSQPECNDMEIVYRHTVDRGIPLLSLARGAAQDALARGRDLRGRVHCA